jgi:5-methylcytosine-specific restriction enzyme A
MAIHAHSTRLPLLPAGLFAGRLLRQGPSRTASPVTNAIAAMRAADTEQAPTITEDGALTALRQGLENPRPSATARGYGPAWRKARAEFLALPDHDICACGCGRKANTVDHIKAHKGNEALFWDRSNWRPVYRDCNSRKAAQSEGAFGNPIRCD